MKTVPLSTEQAPPISVPFRFFMTAPLFLLAAAIMLVSGSDNPFADARTPALLAATHCITLGFMAMIMLGAMQQILPVVVVSPMPASRLTAQVTFLPLISGALLLPAGIVLAKPVMLNIAWPLLGTAFTAFIVASLVSLARSPAHNATKTSIILSLLALGGAIVLGILLACGYATGRVLPYEQIAVSHINLALGGWVLLLIVGISYQVVPMFQLTPNYPGWLCIILSPAIFFITMLNLLSILFEFRPNWAVVSLQSLFWLFAGGYAVTTLILQSRRRRRVADVTLSFFRLGMIALLCAALFAMISLSYPSIEQFRTLTVVLFVLGFAMSLIHGMLYKIVPFLVWFHLFRGGKKRVVPNMREIIPERLMWLHLWLHRCTLFAAMLAPWWYAAAWFTALGLLLQGMAIGYSMFLAIAVYRGTFNRLQEELT